SNRPMLCLLSASSQAFNLCSTSNLRWIKCVQQLESPLKDILASGGTLSSSLTKESLKSLTIDGYFLVHPSVLKNPSFLSSTAHSIYNHMSKLLDKSAWHRYWHVTRNHGFETGRQLHYSVALNPTTPSEDLLAPHLTDLAMRAVDAFYG